MMTPDEYAGHVVEIRGHRRREPIKNCDRDDYYRRPQLVMERYKRDTMRTVRLFIDGEITFGECLLALDHALGDLLRSPLAEWQSINALCSVMRANLEAVMDERERRSSWRVSKLEGSWSAEDIREAGAELRKAEREAAEIRIRAERRAGEVLAEMTADGERATPKDTAFGPRVTRAPENKTLSDLGTTRGPWQ